MLHIRAGMLYDLRAVCGYRCRRLSGSSDVPRGSTEQRRRRIQSCIRKDGQMDKWNQITGSNNERNPKVSCVSTQAFCILSNMAVVFHGPYDKNKDRWDYPLKLHIQQKEENDMKGRAGGESLQQPSILEPLHIRTVTPEIARAPRN